MTVNKPQKVPKIDLLPTTLIQIPGMKRTSSFFMLTNLIPEEISSAQLDSEQKRTNVTKITLQKSQIFKMHPSIHPSITADLADSSVSPRPHRQNNGLEPEPEAQLHCNRIDMQVKPHRGD